MELSPMIAVEMAWSSSGVKRDELNTKRGEMSGNGSLCSIRRLLAEAGRGEAGRLL